MGKIRRVFFFATDLFGANGGIAHYNRCLCKSLEEKAEIAEIVALSFNNSDTSLGSKTTVVSGSNGSKLKYALLSVYWSLRKNSDLVICGHVGLLPVAYVASLLLRCPVVLQVHGVEVWSKPSFLRQLLLRRVTRVWSVSRFTLKRMGEYLPGLGEWSDVIPNTIEVESYGGEIDSQNIVEKFGLQNKTILLTLARHSSEERYKGVDELIESMPQLLEEFPDLVYVVAGSGDDLPRLENKVIDMGLQESVVFTGFLSDPEKRQLLSVTDSFVLAGWGEGFGIVLLEALASGAPVVASVLDGSREAVLDGKLGTLVDPRSQKSLVSGILTSLKQPRLIPAGLEYFAWPSYVKAMHSSICVLEN